MATTTYRSPNGQTFQLHPDAVPVVEPFFNRLNQVYPGYQSAGGYAHRPMRTLDGRNLGGLSTHATGYTLDVKAPDPVLRQMHQEFPHLKWGGKFSHYDPVHFEFGPTAQKYGELSPLNPASLLDPNAAAPTPGPQPPAIAPSGGAAPMTPMQPMTPYTGPSPDDVAQQRRMAQMLMQQATSAEPVGHWTQALARVVQGGVGGMYRNAAQEGEQQGRESVAQLLSGNPTPQALVNNPYTREMGQQLWLAQAKSKMQGPEEYGKSGAIFQGPDGRFYSMQFGSRGERSVKPVEVDGKPLTPAKGVGVVGDEMYNTATGAPVRNVAPQITNKNIAEKTGDLVVKTRGELPEAKQRLTLLDSALDRLNSGVERLEARPGLSRIVGGLYQAKTPNITPDAVTAQTDLDNLKTQISGTVLQSMRDMSKTGGAVGAVTEREWPRLENMLANLAQTQDLPSFKVQLGEIKKYVREVKQAARDAYEADLRTAVSGPTPSTQPAGPPAQAVEFLRTQPTPEMRQFFDQKYGPGASDAVLGGR